MGLLGGWSSTICQMCDGIKPLTSLSLDFHFLKEENKNSSYLGFLKECMRSQLKGSIPCLGTIAEMWPVWSSRVLFLIEVQRMRCRCRLES